ncbi:hypothetical protein BDZ91DRAFT_228952 [Kalaharituber pfeilii]|nr:hypothetical protein BDZ91DRAFT_228952 [Kalaharituber pfeilii]
MFILHHFYPLRLIFNFKNPFEYFTLFFTLDIIDHLIYNTDMMTRGFPYINPNLWNPLSREVNPGWPVRSAATGGMPYLAQSAALEFHYGKGTARAKEVVAQVGAWNGTDGGIRTLVDLRATLAHIVKEFWVPEMIDFVTIQLKRKINEERNIQCRKVHALSAEESASIARNALEKREAVEEWEIQDRPFSMYILCPND